MQPAINQKQIVATLTNTTAKPLFIATSGVTKRHGDTGSGTWHHIINPQTGQPATTDILTVTVTSDSGVKADVYAKTIIIAGREQATILKQAGHIRSFILQYQDRVVTRLE